MGELPSTVTNESVYFCHVPEKKYFEQEPIQRRFGLVMYYISAGQTSRLQYNESLRWVASMYIFFSI